MEHNEHYTVTIYLAAPGTPLEGGGTALMGHMYLQTAHGAQRDSYGFGPAPDAASGVVSYTDADTYKDPYYARTLEITREQFDRIRAFGAHPAAHGFNINGPVFTSSCVDFAWAALGHAGIHRQTGADTDHDSEFAVLFNQPEVQCIAAPVPGSALNTEHHNPLPERDVWQRRLAEMERQKAARRPAPPPATPADPSHPDHRLLTQLNSKVAELDAANGRTFDATSERISASLLALAKQNNLSRVDHVLLSRRTEDNAAAENIFIVQGDRDDPAHLRASMPTEVAAKTAVDESLKRAK